MNKLRRFAGKHPLAFVFLAILLLFVLMGGSAVVAVTLLPYDLTDVAPQVIGQIVATTGFRLLLWRLDWLAPAGIARLGSRRLWLITLLILVYTGLCALYGFFGTLRVDWSVDPNAFPALVHTTMAGVMEEILFRGLILYVLVAPWGHSRPGIVAAVAVSALLFGGLHFVNVLLDAPVAVTTVQVTEAFLSAILYGALVLVGGTVWPAVALHSLINLLVNAAAVNVPGFEAGAGEYLTFTLLELPTSIFGLYLLTRVSLRPAATVDSTMVETATTVP